MSRSVSQVSNPSRVSINAGTQGFFLGANANMVDRTYQDESTIFASCVRPVPHRLPNVQEDPVLEIGQNPLDYLMSTDQDFHINDLMKSSYNPLAKDDYYAYPTSNATSTTPSLVSADSVAAADMDPLTRENSSVGHAFLDALPPPLSRTVSQDPADFGINLAAAAEKAAVVVPYRFGMDPFVAEKIGPVPFTLNVSQDSSPPTLYPVPESVGMSRTGSNSSIRSTMSNQERRAKEAFGRQIQNGLRTPIAPRGDPETIKSTSGRPSNGSSPSKSSASAKRHSTITQQYQRRKQPKVFCDKCDEYPAGFRGEHEFRRHTNSKHAAKVTKWICRDPAKDGIKSSVEAIHPLQKCKACVSAKQYGAYYNAAAHLRRAHFRKRAMRGKKHLDNGERRKLKPHDSSWPPMSELKHWMVQIQVRKGDGGEIIEEEVGEVGEEHTMVNDPDVQLESSRGVDLAKPQELRPNMRDDIVFVTSENGAGFDYAGLDANAYPGMIRDLSILDPIETMMDVMDGMDGMDVSQNPAAMNSASSSFEFPTFQHSASASPYQAAISPMTSPNPGSSATFGLFQIPDAFDNRLG